MRFSNVFGLLAVGSALSAGIFLGCGDDSSSSTTTTSTSTTSSTGGTSGGFPCSPTDPVCTSVKSDCVALVDNADAAMANLRMSQLTIASPKALAEGLVANVVGGAVLMNLAQCNLDGDGSFSWLLQIDNAGGMMKTGGAKPVDDPTAGYCFVKETINGLPIAPSTFAATVGADGSFTGAVGDLTIPIYTAAGVVLLPLHKTSLDGKVSADKNCIGKFNADTLDPKNNCAADPPDVLAFTNAGHLQGYVTLEEADGVIVDTLMQSLCVILSGDPATYGDDATPKKCKRDAMNKIVYQGGWCAGTDMAAGGGCADAEHLTADYAASAVKVTGDCK